MKRAEVDLLDARQQHWVAAVEAPCRNWAAVPGCRSHARYLVDKDMTPSVSRFERFDSRGDCLQWIMAHRVQLTAQLPGATVRPVPLANWLLGLA